MKTKNLVCLLLAVLLMISGCGSEKEDETAAKETAAVQETETETETETDDPNTVDDLPDDLYFDGADFNLYSPDDWGGISFVEDITGELVNDVQYEMEASTEERLGVSIQETPGEYWGMVQSVLNMVASGDTTYDSITLMDRFSLQCAMQHCFLPIQNVEYINLTKDYWGTTLSETLTVGGNQFFAVGSFNLKAYDGITCVLFNKNLAEKYQVEIPFDAVEEGTWTYDMMDSYRGICTVDLNGDGVMDTSDLYTYGTSDLSNLVIQCYMGADITVVEKDENDIPYIAIYGNEKFVNILEWIYDHFFSGNDSYYADKMVDTLALFMEDKHMIHFTKFGTITMMRDMESDFSILPSPKYDESQQNYVSRTYDAMFTMVPVTATDPSKSGAVLEALSSYGYKYLLPAFIEDTLQNKYSRDEDSVRSIQIAMESRTIDMGEAFMYDIFGNEAMRDMMYKTDLNIASHIQSIQKKADVTLQKIVTALTEEN